MNGMINILFIFHGSSNKIKLKLNQSYFFEPFISKQVLLLTIYIL
jgi:hypothetical protein